MVKGTVRGEEKEEGVGETEGKLKKIHEEREPRASEELREL
jgi:hypothetical protein